MIKRVRTDKKTMLPKVVVETDLSETNLAMKQGPESEAKAMKVSKKKSAIVVGNESGVSVAASGGKLPGSIAKKLNGQASAGVKRKAAPNNVERPKKAMKFADNRKSMVVAYVSENQVEEKAALPRPAPHRAKTTARTLTIVRRSPRLKATKATPKAISMKLKRYKVPFYQEKSPRGLREKVAPIKAMKAATVRGKFVPMKLKATRAKIAMEAAVKKGKNVVKAAEVQDDSPDEEDGKTIPMKAMKGPAKKGLTVAKQDAGKDMVAKGKAELRCMDKTELKATQEMLASLRQEKLAQETRVREVMSRRRAELNALSPGDLKELHASMGLKGGGSKSEKVERMLAHAQENGEFERILADQARELRKEQLISMDKSILAKLCESARIDPVMKEVMVERILAHEAYAGVTVKLPPTNGKAVPKAKATATVNKMAMTATTAMKAKK